MKLFAIWLVVTALAVITLSGQVPTPAPQMPIGTTMPASAPPTKLVASDAPATLQGRVIAADTGRALHRARVLMNGVGIGGQRREAMTDSDGRYRFENVPPGDYMIYSSRAGFVEMRAGQKRPDERVYPIAIPPGDVQRVDFALPRGSVISGRLTDDAGEPIAGIRLVPVRVGYGPNGERLSSFTRMPFGNDYTDDRGEFRVAGLTPGTYILAADGQDHPAGETSATTYYPGTRNLSDARRFRIGLSEQITASFSMLTGRRVRVSGEVRSSSGAPLESYRAILRTETGQIINGGQIKDASGAFDFSGVQPGSYKLDISRTGMSGMPNFYQQSEFASLPIDVGEDDISGLLVTTGPGTTISGRVIDDSAAPTRAARQRPRVVAEIIDGGPPGMRPPSADQNNGIIADDGRFTITGTYGKMLFRAGGPGRQLRSVTLDGVDITDVPYDAMRGGTDRLEIVVTDEQQEVKGRVVNAIGKSPDGFVVLIFPSTLKEGAVPGRFISATRYQVMDGAFRTTNLPPGDYLAAALASLPEGAQFDPDVREGVRNRATPFHVSPGRTTTLELTLIE